MALPVAAVGFLLGGAFMYLISDHTQKNTKEAKDDLQEILNDRRELINKVEEILREKELNGEIEIKKKI